MNTVQMTITATRATEDRRFPAFILRGDAQGADAVGVQQEDGTWQIGYSAVAYDGIGILGIGTLMIGDKPVWFGSADSIDRGLRFDSVQDAIAHAEQHEWATDVN